MGNDGILGIAAIKLNLTKFKQRFWLINLASTGCGVIKRTSPNALNQRTTGTINSRYMSTSKWGASFDLKMGSSARFAKKVHSSVK